MVEEMREAIEALTSDDSVNVVLIRGAGGAFCAGMDLEARRVDPLPAWVAHMPDLWADFHAAVWSCPKPVVGAVERAAIAGGSALCFACDFIVVGETTRVGAREARMGMAAPINVVWLLTRWGYQTAVTVTTTARDFTGRELLDLGLAYKCVADAAVLDEARALADELAQNNPGAMATIKRSIQRLSGVSDFRDLLRQAQARA